MPIAHDHLFSSRVNSTQLCIGNGKCMGMRYVKKDDTKKEDTDIQSIKTYVTVSEILFLGNLFLKFFL